MTQTRALIWKEWYEVRGFFAIAMFVFLGLPLIGAAEDLVARQRFDLSAATWVFGLGGLLAVFVGVGTVVRDLNGKLEEFWRSRPVSVWRWLIVKYFTGLAVVLGTLIVPLLVEMAVNRKHDEIGVGSSLILAWHPFFWAAAYSIAFAIACLVRRGAHAAMLSIAALLLLYFLPQVIPPLRFLSLWWVIDQSGEPEVDRAGRLLAVYHRVPLLGVLYRPRQLWFVAAMIALCVIALTVAVTAVRRDWRVESGRKTMYWSIGGAILILFCSAAFQVASNLTILQTIELNAYTVVTYGANDEGVMLMARSDIPHQSGMPILRTFRATLSGIELGPEVECEKWPQLGLHPVWVPGRPDVLYAAGTVGNDSGNFPLLATTSGGGEGVCTTIQRFPQFAVPSAVPERTVEWWAPPPIIWQGRLYMIGPKVLTFDLSDPLKPRLLSAEPLRWTSYSHDPQTWRFLEDRTEDVTTAALKLPQVGPLPPRQRLELVAKTFDRAFLCGDVLVRLYDDHITTYRMEQLTKTSVTFQRLGRYEPTALHRLIGSRYWW
ncbi:MAG TPA: hypothetical protein VK797_04540, partial [Tepidisphaeraceae bacterium]|nr:hypothetical protein [Tepidisphaeraceae bacterium]